MSESSTVPPVQGAQAQTAAPPDIDEKINQFFFLIFRSNPATGYVHIILDGGIETMMKRERFIKVLRPLVGYDCSCEVDSACNEYGRFYIIDRQKLTVTNVLPQADMKHLIAGSAAKMRDKMQPAQNPIDRQFDSSRRDAPKIFSIPSGQTDGSASSSGGRETSY